MDSKIIGEGTYGCVFKPSLPCADKKITYKNKIAKFMLTESALKEIEEYAVIARADKDAKFYTGKPTRCAMKEGADTLKAVSQCKLFQKKLKNKTAKQVSAETSLLLINDGGDDLDKWVKKITSLNSLPPKVITDFWREGLRLFRGLQVFKTYSLVHHDLKPQNVVYRMDTKRLNFIDFGLMRSIKTEALKCKAAKGCVANSHWNYPIDIIFMGKSVYNSAVKRRSAFVEEYYKKIGTKDPFAVAYDTFIKYGFGDEEDERRKIFEQKFWAGFKLLVAKLPSGGYSTFLDASLKGFDVFGLGFTLLYVLSRTRKWLDAKVGAELDELFFKMMTPDVFSRLTIEQAIVEYERIIKGLS